MINRSLFILAIVIQALCSFAQNDSGFVLHKGIISGVGTVGVGHMPVLNISNAYITGNLEYYAERNVSIRGDGYYFVNSLGENSPLKQNSSIYFGAFYHFSTHSGFDPLIGLQPGASITQMRANDSYANPLAYYDAVTVCPLASLVVGFNFFAEKWFHIQCNVRYTAGWYLASGSANGAVMPDEYNISEFTFNFGLGWNLDLISRRKK